MSDQIDEEAEAAADEHAAEFFQALGISIVSWQYVEGAIFKIFHSFFRGSEYPIVSAAFHSVSNLTTRLEMIDAAIHTALQSSPVAQEWGKHKKKIRAFAQKRNFLVHYMFLGNISGTTITLHLSRSIYDQRANVRRDVDLNQIRTYTKAFDDLTKRLENFVDSLVKVLPPNAYPYLGEAGGTP
jgi:hypothetical protein